MQSNGELTIGYGGLTTEKVTVASCKQDKLNQGSALGGARWPTTVGGKTEQLASVSFLFFKNFSLMNIIQIYCEG